MLEKNSAESYDGMDGYTSGIFETRSNSIQWAIASFIPYTVSSNAATLRDLNLLVSM